MLSISISAPKIFSEIMGHGNIFKKPVRKNTVWFCNTSQENPDYGRGDLPRTTSPLPAEVGTNFTDGKRSLGQYSSIADSGHGVMVL
jgi:hypothetical protein